MYRKEGVLELGLEYRIVRLTKLYKLSYKILTLRQRSLQHAIMHSKNKYGTPRSCERLL